MLAVLDGRREVLPHKKRLPVRAARHAAHGIWAAAKKRQHAESLETAAAGARTFAGASGAARLLRKPRAACSLQKSAHARTLSRLRGFLQKPCGKRRRCETHVMQDLVQSSGKPCAAGSAFKNRRRVPPERSAL